MHINIFIRCTVYYSYIFVAIFPKEYGISIEQTFFQFFYFISKRRKKIVIYYAKNSFILSVAHALSSKYINIKFLTVTY